MAADQGDYDGAHVLLEESLTILRELGDRRSIAEGLEALASVDTGETDEERGARLWGAAETLRETIGSPQRPADREKQERMVAVVREKMGVDAFAFAWAEGRTMTMEQAVAYALGEKT